MAKINFFEEEIDFKLKNKKNLRNWIEQTIVAENHILKEINFIFCSDKYLLKINQDYLQHDTYTDIITFDNSETKKEIAGDIFISVERVAENASTYQITTLDELYRVLIHGTLHLLGYKDKSAKDKKLMTDKENFYLASMVNNNQK
ncbi:rRNA maturation RNase YbeY [Mucilaginibacter arboris]|uniref:Endoribonuclease YbeY n=1 Tax=Mucilaginibacter arboris TaxID=2682090 RepID=A0A7K1SSA1_9SPHI|nr:rRNA maturation RNase YbeY [Mucilaginibacter arboris]MVN20181.1 rRNA maturation RNase YbeY [Mucilaginibacter arboris]